MDNARSTGGFPLRVGLGYDVHKLAEGYDLMLCGIKVPSEKGAVGHSDADVVLHAICDAMLGAAALGDIGHHFPDNDPVYKGIASTKLLLRTAESVEKAGWRIVNIDAVIMLQAPKVAPYITDMRSHLAKSLKIAIDCVSVKATTTERLGFVGTGEGVASQAVVMLTAINQDRTFCNERML